MNAFIIYLAKMNVAISLSAILYLLLLRKDTFFQLKRVYFIASFLFASIFSFMVFRVPSSVIHYFFKQPKNVGTVIIPDQFSMEVIPDAVPTPAIDWESIITSGLITLYIIIAVFLLLKILIQFIKIYQLKRKSELQQFKQYQFLQNDTIKNPFSFFKWIFINRNLHNDGELSEVLIHEHTHANQFHSIDTILTEIMLAINWWNPFMWLLKREVIINLENIADSKVLNEGIDRKSYQYHLLKLTYPETAVQITNKFNVSQLKKRIIMMNKSKSSKRSYLKLLFTIPLMASLILANSIYAERTNDTSIELLQNQQVEETNLNQPANVLSQSIDDDKVYSLVDKAPAFPGGEKAMYQFLATNIKYPVKAQESNIQGRVICQFIVEKDGSISNIKIARGVVPMLDNEAIRVIKMMPKWKPGEQKGKTVRVAYTLPIAFRLQGNDNKQEQSSEEMIEDNDLIVVGYAAEKSDNIFDMPDKAPYFPGGENAMYNFLSQTIRYPAEAIKNNIQGRVICQFIVEKDGSISNIKIIQSVSPKLNYEAFRVIKAMPKWNPGTLKGKPVRVRYTLPIQFRLSEEYETKSIKAEDKIYDTVEEAPSFPGGLEVMYEFLGKNVKYPKAAQDKNIQGVVVAQFIVEKDGSINFIKILRGVDNLLDSEAIRVISSMPKWKPGKQNGKTVRVKFTLPIQFKLSGDDNKSNQVEDNVYDITDACLQSVHEREHQKEDNVYGRVDTPPQFPGEDAAMYEFLGKNVKYPKAAQDKNIQGKVVCQFIVEKDGSISNIKVVRGVNPLLDNEAIRVIKAMPKWKPGILKGEPVRILYTLPIQFRLS